MLNRRDFLQTSGFLASSLLVSPLSSSAASSTDSPYRIASFRFDVTPPLGHSLCGGWILPTLEITDPLEAIGYVILGPDLPIVVCAVDWTGIMNGAHLLWRETLAQAVGTTPERVAVHCVHQHNAPFVCLEAQSLIEPYQELPAIVDREFFDQVLQQASQAVKDSLAAAVPLTHIAVGESSVEKVAGNRRLIGLNGKVIGQRGSSSRVPWHWDYPEGLIDPVLKTVVFYSGKKKVVSAHYYACHPMSYYGDGLVSADFCGLARRQRQQAEPECMHIYFNGCGGNIGAGKYNNGNHDMRPVLVERMLTGIEQSEENLLRSPVNQLQWTTAEILPPPQPIFQAEVLQQLIADPMQKTVTRNRSAMTLAWLKRFESRQPIVLSGLHINDVSILHLPAESFVEYQLRAQASQPERFVACAAYGDGGPWYIPTKEAYPQGGYAVSVAWCDPQIDDQLCAGLGQLLKPFA